MVAARFLCCSLWRSPLQEEEIWGELWPIGDLCQNSLLLKDGPRVIFGEVLEELVPVWSPCRISLGRMASCGRNPTMEKRQRVTVKTVKCYVLTAAPLPCSPVQFRGKDVEKGGWGKLFLFFHCSSFLAIVANKLLIALMSLYWILRPLSLFHCIFFPFPFEEEEWESSYGRGCAPYLHKSHEKFGDSFPFPLPRKVRRNATQKHLSLDDNKTTKRGIQIEKIIIKLSASLSYKIRKIWTKQA